MYETAIFPLPLLNLTSPSHRVPLPRFPSGCENFGDSAINKGRGIQTMGEWCEMHHGENRGGGEFCDDNDAFARVYNLLLHEYIYYFTPVHF